MALSDLKVYSEWAYKTKTEILAQQTELFNKATEGTIVLKGGSNAGDFNSSSLYAKVAGGTVRRRDAYGSGGIPSKSLKHSEETSVKIAVGTYEMHIDPGQFRWIKQNPKIAGAMLGKQMAADAMGDMLNTSLGCTMAALSNVSGVILNLSGATPPENHISFRNLNKAAALFGDRSADIAAWIMHSTPLHTLYDNALTNNEGLFSYGTVNVIRDPFGKLLIATDSPNLIMGGTYYTTLGLVPGAIIVEENDDFDSVEVSSTGLDNIARTWQAEWSYNLTIQGFAWDKATGGPSPSDAALLITDNWNRWATSDKDLAGVMLVSA